ncbi:hypothetical protein [Ideonella sp.]|jgi:hypothetical protein|uniref:hypothetical protein n=1 Tax=Ideonella sp. TaxID=1929293 RepID=UPI0037BE64D5
MAHSFLRLVAAQPELLAEHALGYMQLAAEEMSCFLAHCRLRLWLTVGAVCGATAAVVLAGVALLLWAMLPITPDSAAWLLWAVPTAPALLAVACALRLRAMMQRRPWRALQVQWALDEAAWRA